MYNKIQNLSINILNSNYKILFSLFVYFLVYSCFYLDYNLALCMNENNFLDIAEAKPSRTIPRSIIQREVSAFVGFSEIIEEQKKIIQVLTEEKLKLQAQNKILTETLRTNLVDEQKSLETISHVLDKIN